MILFFIFFRIFSNFFKKIFNQILVLFFFFGLTLTKFFFFIVNAEFKCLKTDGVQCPQTAGENGKLFGLAIFIKSILH